MVEVATQEDINRLDARLKDLEASIQKGHARSARLEARFNTQETAAQRVPGSPDVTRIVDGSAGGSRGNIPNADRYGGSPVDNEPNHDTQAQRKQRQRIRDNGEATDQAVLDAGYYVPGSQIKAPEEEAVTPSQQETLRNALVNPDPNDPNNPVNAVPSVDEQARSAKASKTSKSKASRSKS